jgi:hypothetical protein
MGEFGRTPGALNVSHGRDHNRLANVMLFGGGGVKGDRVIGATDAIGAKVVIPGWRHGRSIYPEDVVAIIYSTLGIDWSKRYREHALRASLLLHRRRFRKHYHQS